MNLISSAANPLVKQARGLADRKARDRSELFLIEGIHHVGQAVTAQWPVEAILYAPDLLTSTFATDLVERARSAGCRVEQVAARIMESLSGKENPQGILAIARQRYMDAAALPHFERGVALVNPQDPGNVGTILRTMDAAGADVLFLLEGGVDAYHPTAVRASMGAIFWKSLMRASFEDLIALVKARGCKMIGATAHADAASPLIGVRPPWILLLGSEQKGLTPAQLSACDLAVSLPMKGRVSSLNLAVAAGILLYQLA